MTDNGLMVFGLNYAAGWYGSLYPLVNAVAQGRQAFGSHRQDGLPRALAYAASAGGAGLMAGARQWYSTFRSTATDAMDAARRFSALDPNRPNFVPLGAAGFTIGAGLGLYSLYSIGRGAYGLAFGRPRDRWLNIGRLAMGGLGMYLGWHALSHYDPQYLTGHAQAYRSTRRP